MLKKIFLGTIVLLLIFLVGCANITKDDLSVYSSVNSHKYTASEIESQEQLDINYDSNTTSVNSELNNAESTEKTEISFITAQDVYSVDTTEIAYTIENKGSTKYYFPAYTFSLEKYVDNKWITVPFDKEYVFMTIARVLEHNEKADGKIDLGKCYDLPLEKGIYRISKYELKSESFEIK